MFIEKTAFEPRITNNRNDDLCNITGRYQESGADADCSAGILCVRGENLPCAGFPNVKNENAFYMEAAGANANAATGIYACNTYETQMLAGRHGNAYYIGTETLGLGIPAGRDGTSPRSFSTAKRLTVSVSATCLQSLAATSSSRSQTACWSPRLRPRPATARSILS